MCWGAGSLEGSNFKFDFNPFWFATSPNIFIYTHFPLNSENQRLTPPLSKSEFLSLPILRSPYHRDGLCLLSPTTSYPLFSLSTFEPFIVTLLIPVDVMVTGVLQNSSLSENGFIQYFGKETLNSGVVYDNIQVWFRIPPDWFPPPPLLLESSISSSTSSSSSLSTTSSSPLNLVRIQIASKKASFIGNYDVGLIINPSPSSTFYSLKDSTSILPFPNSTGLWNSWKACLISPIFKNLPLNQSTHFEIQTRRKDLDLILISTPTPSSSQVRFPLTQSLGLDQRAIYSFHGILNRKGIWYLSSYETKSDGSMIFCHGLTFSVSTPPFD